LKSPRLVQLEQARKEIDAEIAEIKAASNIKITKAERKNLEALHEAYIESTMVQIKCEVGVLIDEEGTIIDYCEEYVSECAQDSGIKKSDIKTLKRASKRLQDELVRLAKKYNTTTTLIEDYYL